MMYPILCQVKYETLHKLVREKALWKQIAFSVVVNWLVAPFLMVRAMHLSPCLHLVLPAKIFISSSVCRGLFYLMNLTCAAA